MFMKPKSKPVSKKASFRPQTPAGLPYSDPSLLKELNEFGPADIPSKLPLFPVEPVEVTQPAGAERRPFILQGEPPVEERDPEKLWKQEREGWKELNEGSGPSFWRSFRRRLIVSVVCFGGIWGVYQVDQPWTRSIQSHIHMALLEEMDFAGTSAWYESVFGGAPSFVPIFGQEQAPPQKVNAQRSLLPPIEGVIVQSFALNLKGVLVAPGMPSAADSSLSREVHSVEAGRVVEVRRDAQKGVFVTVQHVDGLTCTYGQLDQTRLKANDWVEEGNIIGQLPKASGTDTPTLFFATQKGDQYIDPVEAVAFD
ncbi:M23 family metallopeptidase [Paenibacillus sp. JX-17]|uniref:M23 family metallopeptidase n=1 Tax=Paenibacillus lacisoli TaxID=3064525 RepID=A0ABT9CG11_9BACL|nr:M23 family metallopeptidase [Paenibacillus sp. JX-17]MDO7906882.1 M23 family metallopeptidase [Paenibacillus sp. JX-17]